MKKLAVAAAAAVVLAAAVWFVAVPEYRPRLRDGEAYGIDVSNHQGRIDWARVADDGIEFAYIKATEGRDFTDQRFADNWRGAAEAGIERGAYHFFTLCSPGADQARHFLATAPPDPTALAPAIDLELSGNCSQRPPRAAVAHEVDTFLAAVEAAWGRPALVYVIGGFDDIYPSRRRLGRPLWHRRILLRPDVGGWAVWQFHFRARVKGVDGPVDLNVRRTDLDG